MVVLAAVSDAKTDAQIVAEADALAQTFGIELHVVHVRNYDSLSDAEADRTDNTIKQRAKKTAANAADSAASTVVSVGRIGQPAAEILAYADTVDARYIVIGGQKRSPVGKALFGSTTQQVLLGADRPVLTVMD